MDARVRVEGRLLRPALSPDGKRKREKIRKKKIGVEGRLLRPALSPDEKKVRSVSRYARY
jgi:hypothetical protein